MDRPGPKGGSWEPPPSPVRPLHPDHPLQPLAGAYGARFAVRACSSGKAVPGWVPGIALPVPTRYTRPCTHPDRTQDPSSSVTPRVTTGRGTPGTCTYDQFRDTVGEPRGSRTQP